MEAHGDGNCTVTMIPIDSDLAHLDDDCANVGELSDRDLTPENLNLKPAMQESKVPGKKLCGYLNKFGMKGPIKTWKYRWFCYDDKKCQLYYYRTARDAVPLGSIDLSTAIFDYKVEAEDGMFEIQTPGRVFILKAVNNHAMIYWLQQLQMKRWEFCNSQTTVPVGSKISSAWPDMHIQRVDFLPPVKTPTEVIGMTAAYLPDLQQSSALQNISLKHPLTEIQNTVRNIYASRLGQANVRSAFHEDEFHVNMEKEEKGNTQAEGKSRAEKESQLENVMTPAIQKSSPSTNLAWMAKKLNSNISPLLEMTMPDRNFQDKITSLQQQVFILSEELKSQKELVRLLHKALEAAQQEKRACSTYLDAPEEKDRLELVRHKVRQVEEQGKQVEALERDRRELSASLAQKEERITELTEHVQLLMQKNSAKQQYIVKLMEHTCSINLIPERDPEALPTETIRQQLEKIEHLQDDIEAYKTQNKFLNSEIHQVTNIWRTVAEKEKVLLMKSTHLEAKNCQLESKYLVVLRKLQEALPDHDMLKSLIEDALQGTDKEGVGQSTIRLNLFSECDDYGFMTIPEYEVEHLKLLAKIQALEIRSNNLLSHEAVEKPLLARWNSLAELIPSVELKNLIRCGIPGEHRQRVWKWVTGCRVQHLRSISYYKSLLQKCESTEHPASRQIELDLHRTLASNKYFSSPTSELVQKLRRVLLAFSWQNPTIGYCQGLNRLAALALLVLEEEESAFWCLVDIVENIMPAEYYSKTLSASQVDQRVFKNFLAEKLPRLTAHFEQHKIDLSLITFNWFLVVFVDSLVSDILLRVWDAFLYEGTKVIFRYALAIFKYNEEEILRIHDSTEIYQYLSFFTKMICDGRKLMNIAFNEMNPFPMKQLQKWRAMHMKKLKAELNELERIKEEYMKEKEDSGTKPLGEVMSEDEEEV
uniref:TBC1 domain family member 2A n=1 Tax=Geotrypetes seraphini TaxID=260995 RepID=A0A6P8PEL1_GEOSA|nr:TBC1 domain family member 2A [Geotrypetes seraphini]